MRPIAKFLIGMLVLLCFCAAATMVLVCGLERAAMSLIRNERHP